MEIRVERRPASDGAILSAVFVDGLFCCYGLEHDGFEIARGRYPVTITPSQRFGRVLPLISNVPGRSGLRIHSGNSDFESSGCLLVGQTVIGSESIGNSKLALGILQTKIAEALAHTQQVWISFEDAPVVKELRA